LTSPLNPGPVIGILAEYNTADEKNFTGTYIASSYVKFAEMGGAKVVPIRSDLPKD